MTTTYLLDNEHVQLYSQRDFSSARRNSKALSGWDAVLCISVITEAEVALWNGKTLSVSRPLFGNRGAIRQFPNSSVGSDEAAAYAQARAPTRTTGLTVATMDMLLRPSNRCRGRACSPRQHLWQMAKVVDRSTSLIGQPIFSPEIGHDNAAFVFPRRARLAYRTTEVDAVVSDERPIAVENGRFELPILVATLPSALTV